MVINKKKVFLNLSMAAIGGVLGYTYWKYVGCESGACAIQSKWYLSTLYGAAIGFFIGGFFIKSKQKKSEDES